MYATIKTVKGVETQLPLTAKEFKTGKTGFFAQTKVVDDEGNRYQTQLIMTKIEAKA